MLNHNPIFHTGFITITLFVLITTVLSCNVIAYDPIGYPAQYWITGTVNDSVDGAAAGVAHGKTVTLHTAGNLSDVIATAFVVGNTYNINAFQTYFIPVGSYQVTIIKSNIDGYGAAAADVTISGAGFDSGPTLTLEKYVGGGPAGMTGKVTYPDETTAIDAVEITITNADTGAAAGFTNTVGDGTYIIELPAGNYNLTAAKEGFNVTQAPAQPVVVAEDVITAGINFQMEALVPTGTVGLTVTRNGDDIRISWTTAAAPDIYYQTGNGTGQFDNDAAGWIKVLDGATGLIEAGVTGFTASIADKYITHTRQVGKTAAEGGIPEVYYKGLVAGNAPADFISLAPAVGKVDVQLGGVAATAGKNLISVPFVFTDNSIPNVFGQGAGSIWANGDLIQRKSSAVNTYFTVEYKDGAWIDQAGGHVLPFTFDNRLGNWVVVKSNKTLTLVGTVTMADVDVNIWAAPNVTEPGKTLLGMIYPKSFGLEATTLIADGAANGDLVQYKSSALAEAYITAELMGGAWKDQAGGAVLPADIAVWKIPHSYIYVRKSTSALTWERSFP